MMAGISPILDAHIRKTMATPGHPSVAKFAVEIGLTQGQLASYIYRNEIFVARRGIAAANTIRKSRPARKKSRKLSEVTDEEILTACRRHTLKGAAAVLGVSTTLLMAETKRLGIAKWARLHKPRKPKLMGPGRALASSGDDHLREVLTTHTGLAAAEILGVSAMTVSRERTRLGVVRVRKPPSARIPFAGADPDDQLEEAEHMVSGKRQRRQYTDAELLEAFYDSTDNAEVARTLGRDLAYVKSAAKRLNIHDVTRTPRIADPVRQRQELDDFMVRHAIKLGIWHLSPEGDVIKHAAGVDPSQERIHPALLDDYERPAAPALKSLRDPKIRRPAEHVVMKRFNMSRSKVLPALDAEETARLVDEAIERGKLKNIQPGYAHNVR